MSNQELQNRKILEELQLQKNQLKLQNNVIPEIKNGNPSITNTNEDSQYKQINEFGQLNPAQRTALQHAHSTSFGYYVPQDSQFGNYIIPVIPRYDTKK